MPRSSPPVTGCLILNASPKRRAPGVEWGAAGMLLLGIVRIFPLLMAEMKESNSSEGIWHMEEMDKSWNHEKKRYTKMVIK